MVNLGSIRTLSTPNSEETKSPFTVTINDLGREFAKLDQLRAALELSSRITGGPASDDGDRLIRRVCGGEVEPSEYYDVYRHICKHVCS